jgi:hypothetical protein
MLLRDTASWLGQSGRSPTTSTPSPKTQGTGGGDRTRTDDPLLAKQVLSQLSYTPFGGQWSDLSGQEKACFLPTTDHCPLIT